MINLRTIYILVAGLCAFAAAQTVLPRYEALVEPIRRVFAAKAVAYNPPVKKSIFDSPEWKEVPIEDTMEGWVEEVTMDGWTEVPPAPKEQPPIKPYILVRGVYQANPAYQEPPQERDSISYALQQELLSIAREQTERLYLLERSTSGYSASWPSIQNNEVQVFNDINNVLVVPDPYYYDGPVYYDRGYSNGYRPAPYHGPVYRSDKPHHHGGHAAGRRR